MNQDCVNDSVIEELYCSALNTTSADKQVSYDMGNL